MTCDKNSFGLTQTADPPNPQLLSAMRFHPDGIVPQYTEGILPAMGKSMDEGTGTAPVGGGAFKVR